MNFLRKPLNLLFVLHAAFFVLVILGVVPRSWVLADTILLGLYFVLAPLEDGIVFFVRAIPFFIAIPLAVNYDNLNMWRLFSIILLAKWFFQRETLQLMKQESVQFFKKPIQFIKEHPLHIALHLLVLLALVSLWHAPDRITGLKRIIYFVNASFVGIVVYFYGQRRKALLERIRRNIAVPIIIVAIAGLLQVISTYFIDIYQFMRIWGEGIDMRLFGSEWSYIAVHVGNTWFAYFGNQLSLRVFSLFPDSHSFPIFLLLGLPAIFAWTLGRPLGEASKLKRMYLTRGKLAVLFVPLVFLMAILSGTRGIWLAGAALVIWVPLVLWFIRWQTADRKKFNIFAYLASYVTVFYLLFFIAYPIFASPQFLVSKGDALLLEKRLESILDFGETSNSQRLDIWKRSLVSIAHHPFVGVGIGNFPVVLGQNIILARAGSSAHNIYLHIAAEIGIGGLIVALYLLWLILRTLYEKFIAAQDVSNQAYFGGLLVTIPWVFAYLMTDVALFDERALLLFAITLGIIFAQ